MAIDTGLRLLLLGQTSITLHLTPQTIQGVRYYGVFNEFPTQGFDLPFVIVAQISEDGWGRLDGTTGVHMTEFDVDCYHNNHTKALAIPASSR